jgi:hypothetical protein
VIVATMFALLVGLLTLAANLAACGSGHHAPTTTETAATKTLTYRWAKPSPLYVQIQGPAKAVLTLAHSLRAHFERTHPTLATKAPGHAICTFPDLQDSVTVRLYGDKSLVSARCKSIARALGE